MEECLCNSYQNTILEIIKKSLEIETDFIQTEIAQQIHFETFHQNKNYIEMMRAVFDSLIIVDIPTEKMTALLSSLYFSMSVLPLIYTKEELAGRIKLLIKMYQYEDTVLEYIPRESIVSTVFFLNETDLVYCLDMSEIEQDLEYDDEEDDGEMKENEAKMEIENSENQEMMDAIQLKKEERKQLKRKKLIEERKIELKKTIVKKLVNSNEMTKEETMKLMKLKMIDLVPMIAYLPFVYSNANFIGNIEKNQFKVNFIKLYKSLSKFSLKTYNYIKVKNTEEAKQIICESPLAVDEKLNQFKQKLYKISIRERIELYERLLSLKNSQQNQQEAKLVKELQTKLKRMSFTHQLTDEEIQQIHFIIHSAPKETIKFLSIKLIKISGFSNIIFDVFKTINSFETDLMMYLLTQSFFPIFQQVMEVSDKIKLYSNKKDTESKSMYEQYKEQLKLINLERSNIVCFMIKMMFYDEKTFEWFHYLLNKCPFGSWVTDYVDEVIVLNEEFNAKVSQETTGDLQTLLDGINNNAKGTKKDSDIFICRKEIGKNKLLEIFINNLVKNNLFMKLIKSIEMEKKHREKDKIYDNISLIENKLIDGLHLLLPESFESFKTHLQSENRKYLTEELMWSIIRRNNQFYLFIKDKYKLYLQKKSYYTEAENRENNFIWNMFYSLGNSFIAIPKSEIHSLQLIQNRCDEKKENELVLQQKINEMKEKIYQFEMVRTTDIMKLKYEINEIFNRKIMNEHIDVNPMGNSNENEISIQKMMKRIEFFMKECVYKRVILNENECKITAQFIESLFTEGICYCNVFLLIDKIIDNLIGLPSILSVKEMGHWGLFIGLLMSFMRDKINEYEFCVGNELYKEKDMNIQYNQTNHQMNSSLNVNFHMKIGNKIISKEQMIYMKETWIKKINCFLFNLLNQTTNKYVFMSLEFIENCWQHIELCAEIRIVLNAFIKGKFKIAQKVNKLLDLFEI